MSHVTQVYCPSKVSLVWGIGGGGWGAGQGQKSPLQRFKTLNVGATLHRPQFPDLPMKKH